VLQTTEGYSPTDGLYAFDLPGEPKYILHY